MITAINDGEEEGRTTESEDVEMLVGVRYGTVPNVVDGWRLVIVTSKRYFTLY